MQQITRSVKGVNSKDLMKDLDTYITEGIEGFQIKWSSESQRDTFVDVVRSLLVEWQEDGKIEQYKIICDRRNNKQVDMNNGIYYFDVFYKQSNCLNMTHLRYTISETGKVSIDFPEVWSISTP